MIKKTYKSILIVQILSTFLGIAGMLIDSCMVSKFLGDECIAAYGLVSPVLLIFTSASAAIAVGAQNQAGEALGRGDKQKANEGYMSAMAMTFAAAVIIAITVLFSAEKISVLLGADESERMLSYSVAYLRGYVVGIPGIAFLMISLPFVQLDGEKKKAGIATFIKTGADIFIDFLVIFVFKQGMFYIGLGSAISVYLADAYIVIHFLNPDNMFGIRFGDIKASEFSGILKNGLPNGLSAVLWTCMMLVMNRLALANGGVNSVAALTIVMSLYNILIVNGTANCNTIAMMSAIYAAEYDTDALREILRLGLLYSFFGNLLVGGIAFIFAKPIAALYVQENAVVLACTCVGIRYIAIRLINCPCGVLRNIFLGMKRLRLTRIMTTCSSFICLALPAILFAELWGMDGVWISFVTADVFVVIGLYLYFSLRKGHIIPRADDYLKIGGDNAVAIQDNTCFDIRKVEDVIEASLRVEELCKAHNENIRTRMHSALLIEELGTNVVNHGFNRHMNEDAFFKIRVFYQSNSLVISMKDNANAFNPTTYMKQFGDGLTTENIGLRLITADAEKVKYTYTFGLNCVLVEV